MTKKHSYRSNDLRSHHGLANRVGRWASASAILIYVAFLLVPLLWAVLTAFKPATDYLASPPRFVPSSWTLVHFEALGRLGAWEAVRNSLIVSTGTTLVAVTVGFLGGYGISRFKAGGRVFAYALVIQRLLPPIVFLVPSFLIFTYVGLLDSLIGLVIAYAAGSITFAIFIIASYLTLVPPDYEESAVIDGANRRQLLWHIVLPIARPSVIAAAGFSFIVGWTEFLFASILTRRNQTLPAFIASFIGAETSLLGELGAMILVASVPAIVLGMFFYRYAVLGLTLGGVKG